MPATFPALEKLRRLCLSLPETSEKSSWGHPNFIAGKRTFVTYEVIDGRPSIAFRLPADASRMLTRGQFFATPYGRGQWVSVWVDGAVDWILVTDLVHRSYRIVALKRMLSALDGGRRAN
jgi:predicted DNA-binding protein (MmcQ/YjbR family)